MKAHPPAGLLIASAILQRTSINEDGTPTSPTFSTSPFNVNPTTSPTSIKKLLNEDAEPPRNAIDEATSPLPIQLPRNLFSTSKPSTSTTLPSTARRNFMRIPLSFNPRLRVQRMGNGKTGGVEGSMSQDDGETDGVEDSMSQDEEYNDTLETTNKGTTKALKDTGYSESHDILTPDPHIEILNAPVPSHPSFQRDTQSVSPVEEQLDDDEDYTQPDMRFCRRRESIDTASSGEDHEEDSRPRGILGMFRQRLRDPDMDEEVEEPDHEVPAFHSHPNVLDLPLGISAASYPSRMTVTVPNVELAGKPRVVYVRLIFRGKRLMPVNPDEEGVADRYESPLSYHALLFDTIKVDVFERSSLLNTHLLSVHMGRARINLRDLRNLRGSTIETFPLFPRRLRAGEYPMLLGFITISFDFHITNPPEPISPLSIPAILEDPLSEDEPESESLIGPDDSVSVMGDLGDPDLGSNFGSQVGTRAQGEEMVREFMHYFGDAARSTSEESGKPVRIFPTSLSSASLTHDPTVHEKKPNERKPISTNWFKTPSVLPRSTMETIREVSNLSAAFFNHGWRISKMEFVWSVLLISRWQNSITDPILLPTSPPTSPRQRSKSNPTPLLSPTIVTDQALITSAHHFMRFAVATYGSALLSSVFEVGKAYVRDFLGSKADRRTALTHLGVKAGDVLEWEFGRGETYKPRYYVCWDEGSRSIVVCIRGTVNLQDIVTDLCAEYDPYRTGHLHRGITRCARWMIDNLLPNLHRYLLDRRATTLNIVGHSLGAAIGSIFTMMVRDMGVLMKWGKEMGVLEGVEMKCWSFGCPPCVSWDLAEEAREVFAFVNESDVVPTLGYGTMVDLRETIIKGAELLRTPKLSDQEKFTALTDFTHHLRTENLHPKCYIPGTLHHIHKIATEVPFVEPPTQEVLPAMAEEERTGGVRRGRSWTNLQGGTLRRQTSGWWMKEMDGKDVETVEDSEDLVGGGLRASPVPEDPMGTGALPAAVPLKTAERYVVERILDRTTLGTIKVGLNMLNNHFPNKYEGALRKVLDGMEHGG